MKDRKFHIYLDDEEYRQVLQALIALKNNLIAQGRYTDAVDDDWNVELMDRSVQNPQPRLEQKDSFMRLVQQNERSSFTDAYREYSEIKSANPDSLVLYQMGDFFEAYGHISASCSLICSFWSARCGCLTGLSVR